MKRKIAAILTDDQGNKIRTSENGNKFVVLECQPELVDGCLMPGKRIAFFADEELLNAIKPDMSVLDK